MQLLRDNKDSLMSVLDAFVHDPLVEWEDEKRKMVRKHIDFVIFLILTAIRHRIGEEQAATKLKIRSILACLLAMR